MMEKLRNQYRNVEFKGKLIKKEAKKIVRRKSSDILNTYDFRNLKEDVKKAQAAIAKMRS